MATEIEIQKCTKIFFDELEQNDELKNSFVELFGILEKISLTCETIEELMMSPEIVAFSKAKNIPHEFLEYIRKEALNFSPAPRTFEEAFVMGQRIGRDFFVLKKELEKKLLIRTFEEAFIMGQLICRHFFILKKEST